MTPESRIIVSVNLLLLLGLTAFCRTLPSASSGDQFGFTIPMATGMGALLMINLGGVIWANSARQESLRQAFGTGILVMLLIGFGLCGWANPGG